MKANIETGARAKTFAAGLLADFEILENRAEPGFPRGSAFGFPPSIL
jgi:hypothetical protein